MVYDDQNFLIYFGDDDKSIRLSNSSSLQQKLEKPLPYLQKELNTKSIVFLKQVHSTNGIVISKEYKLRYPLDVPSMHGDIILTNLEDVGIGVLTADCLPVIFYDNVRHAIAIAHAGWKGTVAKVSQRAIKMMQERFKSDPKDIEVHFGPSAKTCCY